jgi:IclR family transcriptional regulator, KDG regulon repressor
MNSTAYRSSTIQRALDIMNLFKHSERLSFSQIQKQLGYNKSTLYRVLSVLQENRYLIRDEDGAYHLGFNIYVLGRSASEEYILKNIALPHMRALVEQTDMTVHMGIIEGSEVVIIEKAEPNKQLRMFSRVGASVPAHCTSQGKLLLAYSDRSKVERIIGEHGLRRYTPNTIATADELHEALEKIRDTGYAVDDSEHERNIYCLAVPVLDYQGKIIASLSITGTKADYPDEGSVQKVLALLTQARDAISKDMDNAPG